MATKRAVKKRKPGPARPVKKATRKVAPKRKANPPAKKKAAPAMDEAAMMAAWEKAMTPSEGHRRLEPMVGSWRARTEFAMGPDAPAQVSDGVSENRLVLGGRFLEQVYSGEAMEMPFEGIGYTGFDNVRGKYVGTWMDSAGTGIMTSLGIGKPSGEAIDTVSEALDPFGQPVRFDCKVRIESRDRHTFEMWTKAPDGRRYRAMRIEYDRK